MHTAQRKCQDNRENKYQQQVRNVSGTCKGLIKGQSLWRREDGHRLVSHTLHGGFTHRARVAGCNHSHDAASGNSSAAGGLSSAKSVYKTVQHQYPLPVCRNGLTAALHLCTQCLFTTNDKVCLSSIVWQINYSTTATVNASKTKPFAYTASTEAATSEGLV